MLAMVLFKDIFLVTCILGLVSAGVLITLRSGLVAAGQARSMQLLGNFYRMLVGLISGAALISIVQQWAGLRVAFLP